MLALLPGLLFFYISTAPPPASLDPCDDLNNEVSQQIQQNAPDGWNALLSLAQDAWACFGDQVPPSLYERIVYVLDQLKRREEALKHANDFFERFAVPEDSSRFARMYQRRGFLHFHLDNLAEAAHDYILALEYADAWTPAQRAYYLLDIGVIFQRFDNFESTQEYYDEAARLLAHADEVDSFFLKARSKFSFFQADLILERAGGSGVLDATAYQRAASLAEESIALSMQEEDLSRAAFAFVSLAEARRHLGDTDAASQHLEQAQRLAPNVTESTFPALLVRRRGHLYLQLGDYDKAERVLTEALGLARAERHIDYERNSLLSLGQLFELQGRFEKAADYFREAMTVTEEYRQSLRMTDWSMLAFSEWQYTHRDLVRVLLAQGLHQEAFEVLEQTRARHLQDLRTQAQLLTELSPDDSARFNALTTALVDMRNQIAVDTLGAEHLNSLRIQEQLLIAQRRALLDLDITFETPSLRAIQHVLAERKQIVLTYFLDSNSVSDVLFGRTPRPHAFVLTPDTLVAVPLQVSADSVRAMLAQVSPLFNKPEAVPDFDDRQFSLTALHDLYNRLYAPVAAYIPNGARLVVIPDGPLFMLPFPMLIEEETPGFQYRDAPFLLKKHPISVELATALLLQKPATAAQPTYDIIAFGKSQFSDTVLPSGLQSTREASSALINLPAVIDEINGIAAHFGNVSTRLNGEATEAAFFEVAATAKILHLASHTLMRASLPLQNAIILSKDPSDGRYDGILYLHEILQRTVPAELVVLSGCGTARGVFHRGEGMAGLQYAFRAMGVHSSLATSWFVDDNTAGQIMQAFYRNLKDGQPKDIALQKAQVQYLAEAGPESASPFLWAAPMIYGDTASMVLKGPFLKEMLRLGVALLLLGLLYLGFRTIRKKTP